MRPWALIVLALVAGCTGTPRPPEGAARDDLRDLALAFVPESIRVHPLTHLEADPPRIVALVEFKDRWGDTTKGVGTLTIQVFEARAGGEPGIETEAAKWDIDLTDLDANAGWFDPVTRMYRFRLVDVPGWVAELAQQASGTGGRVHLRATLRTVSVNGREVSLRHDFTLEH